MAGRLGHGWGQTPALHFSCDAGLSLLGRRWLVSPAGAGIDPGSESGTCFRANRLCRQGPAHQGMKKGSGVVCATPPAPSWGRAPALHFSCDAGLSLLGRRWLVSRASAGIHPGSESGTRFRSNRSCLLVPAHQVVKSRSCGLVQRISTAGSATPRPLRGTSPRATFSHSAIGHRSTSRHVSPVESRHRG